MKYKQITPFYPNSLRRTKLAYTNKFQWKRKY